VKNGSGKIEENERCHDKIVAAPPQMNGAEASELRTTEATLTSTESL